MRNRTRRSPVFGCRHALLLATAACLAPPAWATGAVPEVAATPPTLTQAAPIVTDWQLRPEDDGGLAFAAEPAPSGAAAGLPAGISLAAVAEPAAFAQDPAGLDPRYRSFGARVGAVKWETLGIFALLTAGNIGKVIDDPQSFRFQEEGLFGRNTGSLGIDKLAHAYNTYLISEILYRRMERKTGGGLPSAVTAAVLGSGLQIYAEVYDGLHAGSGASVADIGFNMAGAAFSVLRNTTPGLKAKLDFRIMIVPNDDFYTFQGKKHFEQQHFLFALKLAGFEGLKNSPLRFLELHAGYRAKDFTIPERLAGVRPQRLPFLGFGFNFAELFLKNRQSWAAKAARTTLQYYQVPYTAIHVDLPTGRLSP